jgi:prepilin-type N-terminal cleavage/methylation domain-containing protein/prepilin-type processing-associated H-X9-DG protein
LKEIAMTALRPCCHTPRRRHGFTLVELLVVIGIIALLIGILMPALRRARESANQIKCLSNMRQLASATIMFANENHGWMPGNGSKNLFKATVSGNTTAWVPGDPMDSLTNWIAWQRQTDPITGATVAGAADENITYSSLAKYLGTKVKLTTGGPAANDANRALEQVFQCPSDNLASRPKADATVGAYRYSYAMNFLVCNPIKGLGAPSNARSWGTFTGRISSIRNPSSVILLVCEDEKTIDDGYFNPNPTQWASGQVEMVAARHAGKVLSAANPTQTGAVNQDNAKGNVSFCDGHGEFMGRKDALRQQYTGNSVPDPAGF